MISKRRYIFCLSCAKVWAAFCIGAFKIQASTPAILFVFES